MSERLSGLQNTSKGGDVRHYSRFIQFLKILLPLLVLGIIGLLILWPQISRVETVPLNRDDLSALRRAETENRLLNPVFNTLDNEGRPFSITAESARQNRDDQDSVFLSRPTAEMHHNDGIFYLQAITGQYKQNDEVLILSDGVLLKDSKDNTLQTDKLVTSITNNTAQSVGPAKLTTKQGTIEGQSVVIDQQKQTTVFQGPAKAVINP